MKKSLLSLLALTIFVSVAGCSSPKKSSSGDTSGDTTAAVPQSIKGGIFSTRLEAYLGALSKGGSGTEFWCKRKEGSEKTLFAVRSYEVLQSEPSDFLKGVYYTVRINSSTQGGNPITKDWLIPVSQETDGSACIDGMIDQSKN